MREHYSLAHTNRRAETERQRCRRQPVFGRVKWWECATIDKFWSAPRSGFSWAGL